MNGESLSQELQPGAAVSVEATTAPPVILVDEHDREVGLAEKLAAHERGVLHRAVSVFAFDADGAMLIQRRARGKYHSGGLWSNAACTHPRVGESNETAARRCLREEMGLECEALERAFAFIYRAQVSATLVEHELDHVFVARIAKTPSPNVDEVEAWRLLPLAQIQREVAEDPSRFSAWFPLALARLQRASTPSGLTAGAPGEGTYG